MKAFVIMPFGEQFDKIYELFIAETLDDMDLKFQRADDIKSQQNILKDIIEGISKSDLIIADLTEPNPNVYYEMGIAHALKKPVISLTQDISELPFDLKSYRVIEYSIHFANIRKAKKELKDLLKEFQSGEMPYSNPVLDFLGKEDLNQITYSTHDTHQEDLGFIDHLVEIENFFKELNDVTMGLADSTNDVGFKTDEATKKIRRATSGGPSQAATIRVRKISQALAKDYGEYSDKIRESNPKYQRINGKIKTSLDFIFNFLDKNIEEYDEEDLIETKETFANMEESLFKAKDELENFQYTLKEIPDFQSDLTKSINQTIDNQDDLIGNVDQTLSTASRTVRLIEKILDKK